MKKVGIILLLAVLVATAAGAVACKQEVSIRFYSEGVQIASVKARPGEDIADMLPADPVRDGYIFDGWYLQSDGTGERQELPVVMPSEDAAYYAKWTEPETHTLTLDPGEGGTLAQSEYRVDDGTNLKSFLADKEPVPVGGLSFAGWYVGSRPLADSAVISADMTVTAKYLATYTMRIYYMDSEGVYPATFSTEQGTALYGEPLDLRSTEGSEHFRLDADAPQSKISVSSLGVSDTFALYFERERYSVFFSADPPQGTVQVGASVSQYYYYGQSFTTDEDLLRLSQPYRLLGWSKQPGGEIWKRIGETMSLEGNTTLYAVWEKGYADMFGGGDLLYPETGNPTHLRLRRTNFEEDRFGFYDTDTGRFYFTEDGTENGKVTLSGRIGGNYFYYYRDVLERSYPDLDGTGDTLSIGANGQTVYTHGGEEIAGSYTVDLDTGYFRFEPTEEDEENTFLFNLFESNSDGSVLYRRQNEQEEGYYVLRDNHFVYLDGLGGLTYFYNDVNYEYQMGSIRIVELSGYYEWQEENGFFLAYTRDAAGILFEMVFNTDTETKPLPTLDGYDDMVYRNGTLSYKDIEFKGILDRDDGVRGIYYDKWEGTDAELYLDGFGSGRFGEIEGEYTLITWLYVYEDEETGGDVSADYDLVRFVGNDRVVRYFRMDTEYGDFETDRTIAPEDMSEGYDYGRHDFGNIYLLGTWFEGFVYIFENGEAEMWTAYSTVGTGEYAYILYTDFVSSVTKQDDGTYLFGSVDASGRLTDGSFRFSLEEGVLTQIFGQTNAVEVDEDITLNTEEGRAFYNDGEEDIPISYGYTLGYVDYYIFNIPIGNDEVYRRNYVRLADGTFVEVQRGDVIDMRDEDRVDGYYIVRLLTVGDKTYLGLMLSGDLFRYIGEGSVTAVEGTSDQYDFVLTEWLREEFVESDLDGWNRFRYKLVQNSGTEGDEYYFVPRMTDPYGLSNLISDGYGKYTYNSGSANVTGVVTSDMECLIYFTADNGTRYIFYNDGEKVTDVTGTQDAGYWYEMNDNQLLSLYAYFVFDGRGNALLYLVDTLTGTATTVTEGKYTRTESWTPLYKEYTVRTNEGGSFYNGTTEINRILVSDTNVMMDSLGNVYVYPLYQRRIPHRVGDFDVVGGGHISSLGYPGEMAVYTDRNGERYSGNMYLGTIYGGDTGPSFTNGINGANAVHFWVYEPTGAYGNYVATDTHFYFELIDDRLVPYSLTFGDYRFFDGENTHADTTLRLGGGGKATLYRGGAIADEGTYVRVEELDAYRYNSATQSFIFRLGYESDGGEDVYVYYLYDPDDDHLYMNEDDWSSLDLDGFGGGTYVDNYGRVYEGYTVIFDEDKGYGYFGAMGMSRIFVLDNATKTFRLTEVEHVFAYYAEDFSSFVSDGVFLTVDGKQCYIVAEQAGLVAYPLDGSAKLTYPIPSAETYVWNAKTYYRYDGGVLSFVNSSFGAELTLSFRPNGAVFGTAATVNGIDTGFNISVSYTRDGISVILTYLSGAMDSIAETYPVTLHYDGNGGHFDIIPGGLSGEYSDSEHEGSTLTIDARRVGPIVVGNKELVFSLGYISDSAGDTFTATGSYDDMIRPVDMYDFHYGNGYRCKATAGDGVEYTLWLYLDQANMEMILCAVTVEKNFTIAAGEVTIMQLWSAVTMFNGYDRYDIVRISLPEDGVTTTTFQSAIEGGAKAALVRQVLNTTSGVYTYEAYVFDISYGEDRLVDGVTIEGTYNYAEAYQGGEYSIRFLYSLDGGFRVRYILTFSVGTTLQSEATFTAAEGTNSFTVALPDGTTYLITVRFGANFTLTVTKQ